LRITGGRLRGKRLTSPLNRAVRPTSDMVREALFDILGPEIAGARFLDCFAGTGAVAFDALSRGAQTAVLVESDPKVAALIRKNAANLGLEPTVIVGDFLKAADRLAEKGQFFDLIFVDPPYASGLQTAAVEKIFASGLPAEGGTVIVEHDRRNELQPNLRQFILTDRRFYGETQLTFFKPTGRK
jgi:16S rRNA (guanine966-N2)-methyltransferase